MYKLGKSEKAFLEKSRGNYSPELKWYGVMTLCGREHPIRDTVVRELRDRGIAETMLPEIPTPVESGCGTRPAELLFPCYLFTRCRMNDEIYMTLAAYDGVISVLGRAWRIPSVLDDLEIQCLQGILHAPQRPELTTLLGIGAGAEVTAGIMQGLRGRVLETSATLVKLETRLSFLNNKTGIIVVVPRSGVRLMQDEPALTALA